LESIDNPFSEPLILTLSTLKNVFDLITAQYKLASSISISIVKDKYKRPKPIYDNKYDPTKPPLASITENYSPYVFRQSLFDNRPAIITRFPKYYILAGASKRPRI
jgi:hypothetical protein